MTGLHITSLLKNEQIEIEHKQSNSERIVIRESQIL